MDFFPIFSVFSQILALYSAHSVVILQVVIGGINVDFIAKGKTKTLHVSFIYNMYLSTLLQICYLL